jgi:hypothetical protein
MTDYESVTCECAYILRDGQVPCGTVLDDQEPDNPPAVSYSTRGRRHKGSGELIDGCQSEKTGREMCSRAQVRKVADIPCSMTCFQ